MLEVALDAPRHRPGDTVSGRVRITESTEARRLLVALRLVEHSPDYTINAVEIEGPPLAEGDLPAGADHPFAFALPDDALPGVRSTHGRLAWELDAWIDRRGRDPHAKVELEVVPAAPRSR